MDHNHRFNLKLFRFRSLDQIRCNMKHLTKLAYESIINRVIPQPNPHSLSLSVVKLVIIFSLSNHHTPQEYRKKMRLLSLTKPRGVLDDNVVVNSGKNKETEWEIKLCYYQHPSLVDYEIHGQHQYTDKIESLLLSCLNAKISSESTLSN